MCNVGRTSDQRHKKAKITDVKMKDLNMFLLMCHHVKCYQVGEVQAKTFGVHEDTASRWTCHYLKKLVAFKKVHIIWLDDFGDCKFILSVNCVNLESMSLATQSFTKSRIFLIAKVERQV